MKAFLRLMTKALIVVTGLSVTPAFAALRLSSSAAYVQDATTRTPVLTKNAATPMPIASMTKLMTAMVVLDAAQPMDETLQVTDDDVDYIKHSSSRVAVGSTFTRGELLHLALMSSDNRAAHALARNTPGGLPHFVQLMNAKARALHLRGTTFTDPTGLESTNVATPADMATIAQTAFQYDKIREYSSDDEEVFNILGRPVLFRNTNSLVRNHNWDIGLSKTGFIQEAGRCMVIQTQVNEKPFFMVLMDAASSAARELDARRIYAWLSGAPAMEPVVRTHARHTAHRTHQMRASKARLIKTKLTKTKPHKKGKRRHSA